MIMIIIIILILILGLRVVLKVRPGRGARQELLGGRGEDDAVVLVISICYIIACITLHVALVVYDIILGYIIV